MEYKAIVTKKYYPKQYNNGLLIDVINRNITGFKLTLEDGSKLDIIVDDDNENAKVMKGDNVILYKSSKDDSFNIRLDGDNYEK